MNSKALIHAIQLAYPQIWFACHIEHRTRGRDRGTGLTDRDAGILAHVGAGAGTGVTATALAEHLGIGKPALSQHLKRLQELELLGIRVDPGDRRQRLVELTATGRAAMSSRSPLDENRLGQLLELIPDRDRLGAVEGLQRLAEAARRLQHQHSKVRSR